MAPWVVDVANVGGNLDAERTTAGVTLSLTYEEAIVLSHLLFRWEDDGTLDDAGRFEDRAEQVVLWNLWSAFHPMIDEAFAPEYGDVLAKAWNRLRVNRAGG